MTQTRASARLTGKSCQTTRLPSYSGNPLRALSTHHHYNEIHLQSYSPKLPTDRSTTDCTPGQVRCASLGQTRLCLESFLTGHRSTDGTPGHFQTPLPPRRPLARTESIKFFKSFAHRVHTVLNNCAHRSQGFKLHVETVYPVSL